MHRFLGDIEGFLSKVFLALKTDGIDVSTYLLDHICYRVETSDRYEQCKMELSKSGQQLSENMINGRPISTYKLREPIVFEGRAIACVEVPAPKAEHNYPEGLEHVEFVIDCSFDEFMGRYARVRFDISNMNNPRNPDVKIQYHGFCVKFHLSSLEDVICYEQS